MKANSLRIDFVIVGAATLLGLALVNFVLGNRLQLQAAITGLLAEGSSSGAAALVLAVLLGAA